MNTQTARRTGARRAAFIVPLIIVNLAALVGQSLWTYGQLTHHFLEHHHKVAAAGSIFLGLAVESIAVYLSLQAHAAMMADQTSGGLRLSSYGIGALMAGVNFTHFSAAPVDSMSLGVMFGLLSLASPWLWAVDSKAAHRAQLAERGIVDPRGVKLSSNRKFWHPLKSVKVTRHASWVGETDPQRAVEGWESTRQSVPQSAQTPQVTVHVGTPSPAVRAIPQSTVPAIESAPESVTESTDESITETVTETVTRTRTQTRSRTEARIQTLTERVESVRVHPDYLSAMDSARELTYDEIGAIIGKKGREVIKPVYLVLYRGQSAQSIILGIDA